MKHSSYYSDRSCQYPDTIVSVMETSGENGSAMPLPGGFEENGSSTSGEMGTSGENAGQEPVIPLPNPGEGGPLPTFPNRPTPSRPPTSPNLPPVFRPIFPGVGGGTSVTIIPGITFPCFNCTSSNLGRVRVLNASTGYQPFYVYLGSWLIASQLGNGDVTSYVQAATGTQTITVSGANGYIYIQKQIQVRSNSSMTVAIINTASGLDLQEISDISCNAPASSSCMRVANLSVNMGPFDVTLENQNSSFTAFTNVRYQEVTPYNSFTPGWYQIYVDRTGTWPASTLATAAANLNANVSYTLYIFNAPTTAEGVRTMVISN